MTEIVNRWLPVLTWLLLLSWAAWVYAPGLSGPSLLDDDKNLSRLAILTEQPEFAADMIWENHSGPLGRPLSMASFVLEKLYFDHGLQGVKRVNLLLHLGIGSLLVLLFRRLLLAAQLPAATWLAIAAAGLWLFSPLHISTVLYSVQRMTQLSALFCVLSLLAYLNWRLPRSTGGCRWCWLGLSSLLWIAGLLAKENALVLPLVILALEWLWFGLGRAATVPAVTYRKRVLVSLPVAALGVVVYLLLWGDWLLFGYRERDFDMVERLLTQARVLFHYLNQLLWPDVAYMGLFHDDFVVSRGLTSPWTTLPAVVLWLVLTLWMIAVPKNRAVRLGLAGLAVFVAGHSLEASVLPLEIYFEHRNYFPSLGIYLTIAALVGIMLQRLPELRRVGWIVVGGVLGWFAVSSGSQATVWSSRELMVLAALEKHPESSRVHTEMAALHARYGERDQAWQWSASAARLAGDSNGDTTLIRDLVLSCVANQPLPADYLVTFNISPQQAQYRSTNNDFATLLRQIQDGHCPRLQALELADRLQQVFLNSGDASAATPNLWTLMAQLESHLQRFEPAYQYIQMLLEKSPGDVRGLFMKMYFAAGLGRIEEMQQIRAQLEEMQARGLLDRQQQHNLALFAD